MKLHPYNEFRDKSFCSFDQDDLNNVEKGRRAGVKYLILCELLHIHGCEQGSSDGSEKSILPREMSCILTVPQPWFEETAPELSFGLSIRTAVESSRDGGFLRASGLGPVRTPSYLFYISH